MGKRVFFTGVKCYWPLRVASLWLVCYSMWSVVAYGDPQHSKNGQISMRHCRLPVLTQVSSNPVIMFSYAPGSNDTLRSVDVLLGEGILVDDLDSIALYVSEVDSLWQSAHYLLKEKVNERQIRLSPNFAIKANNRVYFWISVRPDDDVDLRHKFSLEIKQLMTSRETKNFDSDTFFKVKHRFGVAVRRHGQDGIHTSRIPGLVTTSSGTLLAIFDARHQSSRDLQGDIDIGLHRSTDGGKTWLPLQIVMDMGKWGGLPEKFNGVSDACLLVNGREIYVAALWMNGVLDKNGKWIEGLSESSTTWNHQWRNKGSQPGFSPRETAQFLLVKSTDDGVTWSEPVNITRMCKKEAWWLWAPAPGRGIVMQDGTLVFPTQGRDENGLPFSNITYSQDGGLTWRTSEPASHNTTECAVAEVTPGTLMLNIRDNRNRQDKSATNGRAVFITTNLGQTWQEHPSSHGALPEPTCMASLYQHQYIENGLKKSLLLFSNPNSKFKRYHLTIKASRDHGHTWPMENWVFLDEGAGRGYSCLTSIDEHTIGILYESSRADLVFQAVDMTDFLLK